MLGRDEGEDAAPESRKPGLSLQGSQKAEPMSAFSYALSENQPKHIPRLLHGGRGAVPRTIRTYVSAVKVRATFQNGDDRPRLEPERLPISIQPER
jgi:hypothetical protein